MISTAQADRFDVIVVGAGPGGATAAALMARQGLRVLLLDKDAFPRDKICGDALSGKCVDVLADLGLAHRMRCVEGVGSWGVTFSGPYGDQVSIPFNKARDKPAAPGYVCRRAVFDHLIVEAAAEAGAEVWQQTAVEDLLWDGDRVIGVRISRRDNPHEGAARLMPIKSKIQNPHEPTRGRSPTDANKATDGVKSIHAPLVVGADGAYSVVARSLGFAQCDPAHYVAGLRAYYEGVTGFHPQHYVELHFVEDALPGYFWIFPLPDGRANVGVGMLSRAIKQRGVRLKPLLDATVAHPRFRDRFAGARRVGPVKGWGLPLGSKPRPMAGSGWLLVGDAASLIDPFTGEGIGNAMISGAQAATWAVRAHTAHTYSAAFLQGYEHAVLNLLRDELRLSTLLQHLVRSRRSWKWLLNMVMRKAARSDELADLISCMFDNPGARRQFFSPLFYLRVLAA